jgi:type I restriction enzyme S subunit
VEENVDGQPNWTLMTPTPNRGPSSFNCWNSVPSCDIDEKAQQKYGLAPGDLVFARTGATTGKSFLIRECPPSVFASYLIRVRVNARVAPEYLSLFF